LEAWEKVFVSSEDFIGSIHGSLGCIACHGGTGGASDMETAHSGVVSDPAAEDACAACHPEVTEGHVNSLHSTLAGYTEVLAVRGSEETWDGLMTAYDNHCAGCHASCGQCHVSRPTSTGGGLLSGHDFRGVPPMNTTCTGCHGSRIENEYKGKNETEDGGTYPADVHFNPGGMPCFTCHSGDEMHGLMEGDPANRYDGPPLPSCTGSGCHEELSDNPQHTFHQDVVACQVCHSIDYKNCYSCHVQLSEEGVPFFRTEPSEMAFQIGRNPIQSEDRPWEYVVVRHVPVSPTSFEYYGENLLPNFNDRPTWVYATPHNIQLQTPQNASCDACHGNPDVFLIEEDVLPEELEANQDVIVYDIPPVVELP
jgi:thiosulfate/3-mercaptopyruvate sulfurtransferase